MTLRNLEQEQPTLEADHAAVRKYLNQFRTLPFLNGQLLQVTIPAGLPYGKAFHSLERPYLGAFIVNATDYADTILVIEPNTAAVSPIGCDPSRQILITVGTSVVDDTTITCWIF